MAFFAFHNQLIIAALAVVAEEREFAAFRTLDLQRKSAGVASYPTRLNQRLAFWASVL